MSQQKYINLFTDFGFKKIFGTEVNKDLLIDFLNELLQGREFITSLTYLKNEHLGASEIDRKAIFDLYCENDKGQKFIIELQKVAQKFFKDRSIYYSTFAIQEQATKGKDWVYELKGVYTIGIMDFKFDEREEHKNKVLTYVQLLDIETKEVFYNKLTFIYLEMPKFNKTEEELVTHFDKWLYVIKNLHKLDDIPARIRDKVFMRLFEQAEVAKYTPQERRTYEDSLKYYRDLKSSMDTYFGQGFDEGFGEGFGEGEKKKALVIARKMKAKGIPTTEIVEFTGLTEEEINLL
jgi:predicted transposase/invertase (TIGR01784 family)